MVIRAVSSGRIQPVTGAGSGFDVHKNTFGPVLIFVMQRFRPTVVELPCRRRAFVVNYVTTLSLSIIN
jgi:hypothetical protein